MKRLVICSILAVVIVAVGIWAVVYVNGVSLGARRQIELIASHYEADEHEAASAALERLERDWGSFADMHILVTDNEHMLEISSSLVKIRSLLETEDDELLNECRLADRLIEIYRKEQLPLFSNIF